MHDRADGPRPQPIDDEAAFISDVTFPDGTSVSPGQFFVKTWRLKNTGTTTWDSSYQLAFIGGDQIGAPASVNLLGSVVPNQTVDISVNMTAPSSGSPKGTWQLRNPQGTYFGPQVTVSIKVVGSSSGAVGGGHITLFDVSPASPSSASSVHVVGRIKAFPEFRAMRFRLGDEIKEMTNFKAVGDQYEISADWNTASLARQGYALAFEVATKNDTSWATPERQVKTYTLTGTPAPAGRPPDRPVLQSPYNWYLKDAGGSSASVQMCVYPSSDPDGNAVQYYFELNNGAQNSGWISSTCWSPTLSPAGYAWHVKAGDGSNESGWSLETWNFNITLGGVSIGDAAFYQVDDTDNTHMCVLVTYGGIDGPEVKAFINLANDGSENGEWKQLDHYGPNTTPDCTTSNVHGFWIRSVNYTTGPHVIRVSAAINNVSSPSYDQSATRTFVLTIPYMRPPGPQESSPATTDNNGTWWNTLVIPFNWTVPLRTDSQTLRVSASADIWNDPAPLVNAALSAATTSYTHTFSQDYGQLYWAIQATNGTGSADSGGGVWFGIDRVAPSCTVQALTATNAESVFQVNWSATDNAAGIRSYDIQYTDSGRGTTAWTDWLLNEPVTKTYELFTGKPGRTYSFKCRATDKAGNTNEYPANAQTITRVDPTTRPPTSWWNSAWTGKRNLIVQNNETGQALPAGYPVRVQFTSGTNPTAAEIYNASQSGVKCNDLRVIYNDTTELNRVVKSCTSSLIEIWFRSQVSIPAGASNSTAHQLYFGNASAGAPLADPNGVWYPYKENDTAYLYFFQEGSGLTTVYDYSGNGRNCSVVDSVLWAQAKFGDGLRFNRSHVDRPHLACGAVGLSSFTVEFWYKADSDDGGLIARQTNPSMSGPWTLSNFDGHLRLDRWCYGGQGCGGTDARSDFSLRDAPYVGRWNYLAVSFNGANEVRFYLNGVLDSIRYFIGNGIITDPGPLEIGSEELNANIGAFRMTSGVKTSFPYGAFASIASEPTTAVGAVINPPVAGSPDLVLVDLTTYPNPSGGFLVQAVFKNQGTMGTQNGFYVDLYRGTVPTGPGTTNSVQFWVNDPVAAGALVTVTTVITDVSLLSAPVGLRAPIQLAPASEVTSTLYAQVDSSGVVSETDNANNIYSTGAEVCLAAPDAYEGDDTSATAQTINFGPSQLRNFTSQSDADWAKFSAQQDEAYRLRTLDLGVSADTYLYLYDTDGTTLLASNDDYGGSLASEINWVAPTNGTYYLLVKHWNPNVSGCGTSYRLSIGAHELFMPLIGK